jgi:hypothetical protein
LSGRDVRSKDGREPDKTCQNLTKPDIAARMGAQEGLAISCKPRRHAQKRILLARRREVRRLYTRARCQILSGW